MLEETMGGLQIISTEDGSQTLYSPNFGQHYHSIFGAAQETQRVFIELGLHYAYDAFEEINLLEMGYGTGLNAWMTAADCTLHQRKVNYTGIEAFPVSAETFGLLQEPAEAPSQLTLKQLNEYPWELAHGVNDYFTLTKNHVRLQDFQTEQRFQLVFYDAFAPSSQEELWSLEAFSKVAGLMQPGGVLTTYCSKGSVQRNLKATGFEVSKHPGPHRKREILRAIFRG